MRTARWCGIAVMLVAVAGCGSAPGAASTTQPTGQTATTVGKTLRTTTGDTYTVLSVSDPATANDGYTKANSGDRLIAPEVQVCAGGTHSHVVFDELFVAVVMADGSRARLEVGGVDPALGSGQLAAGKCARGFVTFEAPLGAAVSAVTLQTTVLGETLTFLM